MRNILFVTVLACLVTTSRAATITVCQTGGCNFNDIQSAINFASNGDVIEIAAGTYVLPTTINTLGKTITLRAWS